MPKKQSTAAHKARQRQAATGEKYTTALRARTPGPVRHRPFSARGAGWAPIIERAGRKLIEVWPNCPGPQGEEKFGDLCWKYVPAGAPGDVGRVISAAVKEASGTCQACPSPGRKRGVGDWDGHYGWVMPWVKTCCDACHHVPEHLRSDSAYLDLGEQYEQPAPGTDGCCVTIEDVAPAVRAQFDQGGVPALPAKPEELREPMWSHGSASRRLQRPRGGAGGGAGVHAGVAGGEAGRRQVGTVGVHGRTAAAGRAGHGRAAGSTQCDGRGKKHRD
ncbi:hypothetical protein [Streptomyces sp. NPDC046870]|uniref:hypothetical protein n=1 Tax=Streptomyces sp. NPDC046870 TaxID=3155135 RepID=UPI003456F3BE